MIAIATIFLLMNICNGKNSKKKSMSMLMVNLCNGWS